MFMKVTVLVLKLCCEDTLANPLQYVLLRDTASSVKDVTFFATKRVFFV